MINFIEELSWRGMICNIMPGTKEQLQKEMTSAYIGIDPTADSLHIGHLASIMMLKHFQIAGHRPIVLIGGATGMIGDPSMKSQERNLLDKTILKKNQQGIKNQLSRFLDLKSNAPNATILLNNYDWIKSYSFLHFIRDIGKYLTVNYMISKDSVKKRLSTDSILGISFAEFSYQLLQGYDYLFLYENYHCRLQMGGSDQWGNMTTGAELIRKKLKGEAFALTCPLITKTNGEKFGKTTLGNIWLDKKYTSPYEFYQFWINISDSDAKKYIKIFTTLSKEEITYLIAEQDKAPHFRPLQKRLAKEITTMVHSEEEYQAAAKTSTILFENSTIDIFQKLPSNMLLNIFNGIPQFEISKNILLSGIKIVDLLTQYTTIFSSKNEVRKLIKTKGLSLNKKIPASIDNMLYISSLIGEKYILVQKGKKYHFLLIAK